MVKIKNTLKRSRDESMEKEKIVHPIHILKSLKQIAFLLLIPLTRGLIVAISGGGVAQWLRGAVVDISIIILGITIIVIYWSQNKYFFTESGLSVEKGIFSKTKTFVLYDNLTTITLTTPYILKLFGVVKFKGDTHSGSNLRTDFTFYIHLKDSYIIKNKLINLDNYKNGLSIYQPSSLYIFLFSLLLSNSAVGGVIAYTFFSQGSKILDIELEQKFIDRVSSILSVVAKGVPTILALLGILVIIGWITAFFRLIIRYAKFKATRMDNSLWISRGLFTKNDSFLQIKDISYIDIKQSILTKIFKIAITYIYCTGYGKDATTAPVFIPAASKKNSEKILKKYLREFSLSKVEVGAKYWFSITSFIGFSLGMALGIGAITIFLSLFLIKWKKIIIFVGIIASIPFIWMLLIKLFDFASTGIGVKNNSISLYYSTNFSLHTIIMPLDKITKIIIRQKNWQKKIGLCDIIINSFSEGRKSHIIRTLPKKDVLNLFKTYNILPYL